MNDFLYIRIDFSISFFRCSCNFLLCNDELIFRKLSLMNKRELCVFISNMSVFS